MLCKKTKKPTFKKKKISFRSFEKISSYNLSPCTYKFPAGSEPKKYTDEINIQKDSYILKSKN